MQLPMRFGRSRLNNIVSQDDAIPFGTFNTYPASAYTQVLVQPVLVPGGCAEELHTGAYKSIHFGLVRAGLGHQLQLLQHSIYLETASLRLKKGT